MRFLAEQGRPDALLGIAEFYGEDDAQEALAREDVRALEERGWVRPHFGGGAGLDTIDVLVLPSGRSFASELAQTWRDKPARRNACRVELLAYLYDSDALGSAQNSVDWGGIFRSGHGTFYGDVWTADEVDAAAGWLQRHDLIGGVQAAEFQGPVRAFLTDEGETCVERYNGDPVSYLERQSGAQAGGVTFNVNGQNVQVASGDHVTQVQNLAQTTQELALALRGIVDLVGALGMSQEDRRELVILTEQAEDDLRSERPTGEPARTLLDRVRGWAGRSLDAASGAAVTLAVNAAASDLGKVVEALS